MEEATARTRLLPLAEDSGTARLRIVTFNCMCTALGVGILAIPHVLADVGLIGGLLLLVVIPLLAERTAAYITTSATLAGQKLLTEIVGEAFGVWSSGAAATVLTLYNFGAVVGGLVVLKQLAPPVLHYLGCISATHGDDSRVMSAMVLAVAATVLVPLSSLEKMEALKFTSFASVLLQLVIALVIATAGVHALFLGETALHGQPPPPPPPPVPWLSLQPLAWMREAPVVAFAFQFHQNVPFLLAELRRYPADSQYASKRDKMQVAVRASLLACASLYACVGLSAVTAFGCGVRKNILVSLSSPRGLSLLPPALVATVQGAMAFVMVCVFPVNAFGLRVGLHALAYGAASRESAASRWAGSGLIVTAASLVAVCVSDLGVLFQLIGATAGTCIMFLLPSLLVLRLSHSSSRPLPRFDPSLAASPCVVPATYEPPSIQSHQPLQPSKQQQRGGFMASRSSPSVFAAPPPTHAAPLAVLVFGFGLSVGVCGVVSIFVDAAE